MNIEDLCEQAGTALDGWNNLYPMLCWEDFPEGSIQQHLSLSPNEMNEVALGALTLIGSLGKTRKFIEGMETLLFRAHPGVIKMVSALAGFQESCVALALALTAKDRVDAGIKTLDANGALFFNNGVADAGFGANLKKLYPAVQNILQGVSDLLPIVRISGKADLGAVTQAHQQVIFATHDQLQLAKATQEELQEKVERAESTLAAVEKAAGDLATIKTEAAADRDTVHKAAIDAQAYLDQVSAILASANELDAKISASDAELTMFDAELDNRLKLFESFKEKTSQALTQNSDREAAIDRLVKEAEEMLKGATVAGLASAFQKSSDDYGKAAEKAQESFQWAIGFLFLSTLPLLLYAIPLDLSSFFADGKVAAPSGSAITITLGGILSRVLFLFPATWYASFVFRRYNKLFDLHKTYQFKANIAMSVEGFRKQAEDYEQEIAAAAFLDLKTAPDSGQYEHHYDGNPNRFTGMVLRAAEGLKENIAAFGKGAAKDAPAK